MTRKHPIHESPRLYPRRWTSLYESARPWNDWGTDPHGSLVTRWLDGPCLDRHFDVPIEATALWVRASRGRFKGAVPYATIEPDPDFYTGSLGWQPDDDDLDLSGPLDSPREEQFDRIELCTEMFEWLTQVVDIAVGENVYIGIDYAIEEEA